MEMWWEGIRVRDRLALQHDSVLFFQAVWSKIQRACQRKMREREKWGRRQRERGRPIDRKTAREREGGGLYNAPVNIIHSFVPLLLLLIMASDVSHLVLSESDMKKRQHAFNKMTCAAQMFCLYFGTCWWFWLIQPPTGCISTSGQNIFSHQTWW